MSKPALLASTALAFIGLGKPAAKKAADDKKPGETNVEKPEGEEEDDDVNQPGPKKNATSYEDGDEPGEDDDPEDGDDEEGRKAARARNALRAAGHRRGAAAERLRVGAILNGVEPAKVELALQLALNTELAPEAAKGVLDKAPSGKRSGLAEAMARHGAATPAPGFSADGPAKGPSLSGLMTAELDRRSAKKKAAGL